MCDRCDKMWDDAVSRGFSPEQLRDLDSRLSCYCDDGAEGEPEQEDRDSAWERANGYAVRIGCSNNLFS